MTEEEEGTKLPESVESAFRNVKNAKYFALDIGGSLTKIAYYSGDETRLHFVKFETKLIEKALNFIRSQTSLTKVKVTGGGAYKYGELLRSIVGSPVDKLNEFECAVSGINFLLRNLSDEVFVYDRRSSPEYVFQPLLPPSELYPYLLVQVGSGVSVLKVEGEGKFSRVGGTATGGGTFWGLGRLLTSAKDFDELLDMASKGDHRNVDLVVSDIYGDIDREILGLSPNVIASAFGKLILNCRKDSFSEQDIARSLLYLICNDICHIASLYALLHNVNTIYFGGFFIRHHPMSMHAIGYSVDFWTKGKVKAKFLRHEGYLCAIGAFLKGAEGLQNSRYSWTENYYGSASFPSVSWKSSSEDQSAPHNLEIDRFERMLNHCPLLVDSKSYIPDTVDLTRDADAREYWLSCFRDSLNKFAERAEQSEAPFVDEETQMNVRERSRRFKEEYLKKLDDFSSRPCAFGNLTVRNLLDLREHCLREFGFYDPYLKQKQLENDKAFELLEPLRNKLECMTSEELHEALARGILAGNVFDWGAKEVALLMESQKGLDFQTALGFIGPRPWLIDDMDQWLVRMNQEPHKCAVIFIDNSGVDIVLGMIPFVECLLKRGTEVILCANNRPVLNDVTYKELIVILQRASAISPVIKDSLGSKRLLPVDSGQGSPCLDLGRLDDDLVKLIIEKNVDLIVLEGMGRAIHTNLYAKFNCESLRVAVLKNKWLAKKLGGEMFSVVFKYQSPSS